MKELNKPAVSQMTALQKAGLLLGILCIVAFCFMPPFSGLSRDSMYTLGVLIYALVFWVTGVLPPSYTAVSAMALFSLLQVLDFEEATAGFGNPAIWVLIGVGFISQAANRTGLGKRMAFSLLSLARGRSRLLILMFMATSFIGSFILPSGIGRTALFVPIALGLASSTGLRPGSNFGKALFLSIPISSTLFNLGIMTAGSTSVFAVQFFRDSVGYKWDFMSWLVVFMPV
ncbi:MAG: SLC13 family permease, partial [Desulfocucumaceae bacterium]